MGDPRARLMDYGELVEKLNDELGVLAEENMLQWDDQTDAQTHSPPGPESWMYLMTEGDTVRLLREDPKKYAYHALLFQALDSVGTTPSAWSTAVYLKGGDSEFRFLYEFDPSKIPLLMRIYAIEQVLPKSELLAKGVVEIARVIDHSTPVESEAESTSKRGL